MPKIKLLCALLILLSASNSLATQIITSDSLRNTLLEVYTSQGCSSCPPAERWLSGFTTKDQLWKTVIPINFHVDYWDRLGWADPFAKSQDTHATWKCVISARLESCQVQGIKWLVWSFPTSIL